MEQARVGLKQGKLIQFRQPALYYMGGYNCRHRWAPMEGREIYKKKKTARGLKQGFKERSREITITKLRAQSGFRIVLRNARGPQGIKLADAWENGRAVEYKRLTESVRNISEAARRQIRSGKKQAGHILLYSEGVFDEEFIIEGIKKPLNLKKMLK
ncbi:CdiA C-terminal domain-containing protein [Caldithrix abyssi]